MNRKKKAEINAFYEMYKKEKEKQECSCGGKLKRVIEWEGIATAEGQGWFGKSDGSKAI